MPSFGDWLKASWASFRARWGVLLAVAGAGGAATMFGVVLPLAPAGLASLFGVGPAWAVWGTASAVSVLAALWLSTWAQAAVLRAALTDETAGRCLSLAWGQTSAFAWVLTLVLLAVAGGYCILVLPGLALAVLLFAAPICAITGEAHGIRALEVSWARVRPRFGSVALRMLAAAAIAAAPARIPYIGWLIAMVWTPFGLVALARLSADLRAADPEPEAQPWMGGAVAGLSAVFVLGTALAVALAVRTVSGVVKSFGGTDALLSRGLDAPTGDALIAALSGKATPEQQRRVLDFLTPPAPSTSTAPAAPAP